MRSRWISRAFAGDASLDRSCAGGQSRDTEFERGRAPVSSVTNVTVADPSLGGSPRSTGTPCAARPSDRLPYPSVAIDANAVTREPAQKLFVARAAS